MEHNLCRGPDVLGGEEAKKASSGKRDENAPCIGEDEGRMDLLLVPSVPAAWVHCGHLGEKKTLSAA